MGSAGDGSAAWFGCIDRHSGAPAAGRQPELGPACGRARSGRAADVGLSSTGALVGRARGSRAFGKLTWQHADIHLGCAASGGSAVSGLGRAWRCAIACTTGRRIPAGGSAASAATLGCTASAATLSRSASTSARRRAASSRAFVGRRACRRGRAASVLGSARRCAAGVGSSRRGFRAASRGPRSVVGRARVAARGLSTRGIMGSSRLASAFGLARVAFF